MQCITEYSAGQVGVIYGFQNTEMLGRDVGRVQVFAQLGVRIIQLTYNGRNAVGDGSTVPDDQGLSAFGAEVVATLQAHHILVDLSHSSRKTCLDALRLGGGDDVAVAARDARAPRGRTARVRRRMGARRGVDREHHQRDRRGGALKMDAAGAEALGSIVSKRTRSRKP